MGDFEEWKQNNTLKYEQYIESVEKAERYQLLLELYLNEKLLYPQEAKEFIDIILINFNTALCEIEHLQKIIREKHVIFVKEKE